MVKNRASQNQSAADYDSQLTRKDPETGTEEQHCAAGIHRKEITEGAAVSFADCGGYDQIFMVDRNRHVKNFQSWM